MSKLSIEQKCLSKEKTVTLFFNAFAAIPISVRGNVIPFFRNIDEISPANFQSKIVISSWCNAVNNYC